MKGHSECNSPMVWTITKQVYTGGLNGSEAGEPKAEEEQTNCRLPTSGPWKPVRLTRGDKSARARTLRNTEN